MNYSCKIVGILVQFCSNAHLSKYLRILNEKKNRIQLFINVFQYF